jgi:hypothetical protein
LAAQFWHASVCPPVCMHAEALLAGVGEGLLFDADGMVRCNVCHLRRWMTPDEIELLIGPQRIRTYSHQKIIS